MFVLEILLVDLIVRESQNVALDAGKHIRCKMEAENDLACCHDYEESGHR